MWTSISLQTRMGALPLCMHSEKIRGLEQIKLTETGPFEKPKVELLRCFSARVYLSPPYSVSLVRSPSQTIPNASSPVNSTSNAEPALLHTQDPCFILQNVFCDLGNSRNGWSPIKRLYAAGCQGYPKVRFLEWACSHELGKWEEPVNEATFSHDQSTH